MKLPKLLYVTRWINLLELDGWVFASRRRPDDPEQIDAVNIIAWHYEGQNKSPCRLVVIEESRKPIIRELKEETGLDVTMVQSTSGVTFSSAGLSDEAHAFISVQCQGVPSLKPGVDGEHIRVHLLGQQDCAALLEKNRQGQAAVSSRLWPILLNIAQAGIFGQIKVAP